MYNEETKNLFLDALQTDELKHMYTSIFNRSKSYEVDLDKDISNFDLKECMSLLVELNPKSIGHVGSLKSQFNKYVSWAVTGGITSKNYWSLVPIDDDFAKFAFSSRYIKDLNELVNVVDIGLSTPYDKYVVYLLYLGVMGENFVELSLLKDDKVDKHKKTITTIRWKYNDIIKPLFDLVISGGGYWEEKKPRDMNSPYFIKPFRTKGMLGEPIGRQYVYRVFQKLNDNFSENNPDNKKYFTPMTIWRSGLLYGLYLVEKTKGSLVSDDYATISEVYGNKIGVSTFFRDYELYKEVFWRE